MVDVCSCYMVMASKRLVIWLILVDTRNGTHHVQIKCGARGWKRDLLGCCNSGCSRLEPKDRSVWTGGPKKQHRSTPHLTLSKASNIQIQSKKYVEHCRTIVYWFNYDGMCVEIYLGSTILSTPIHKDLPNLPAQNHGNPYRTGIHWAEVGTSHTNCAKRGVSTTSKAWRKYRGDPIR